MPRINKKYFLSGDVVKLAKDLLGKVLVTNIEGKRTAGIIVETEAYNGTADRACHAYGGRKTSRTEIMFKEGGVAYVYLCYGIHHLFNIVVAKADDPKAVLIRGIKPVEGIETILSRRKAKQLTRSLCIGPGKVAQALGIQTLHTGEPLTSDAIFLEDRGIRFSSSKIRSGPRIGVDYAGEDALLPYRFYIEGEV